MMIVGCLKMKMNSIRDYSRKVNITDSTINAFLNSIDYALFDDKNMIDTKITIGDLLLIHYLHNLICDSHEILITTGYKSN